MRALMLSTILVISTLLAQVVLASENKNVEVYFNNEKLELALDPVMIEYKVWIPARALFEALEAEVSWDALTRGVRAEKGNTKVTIQIGSRFAYVNREKIILGRDVFIKEDLTFVPLQLLTDAFGCSVETEDAGDNLQVIRVMTVEDEPVTVDTFP